MCGSDGCVYEFHYQAPYDTLGSSVPGLDLLVPQIPRPVSEALGISAAAKCRKTNLSSSRVADYVPGFITSIASSAGLLAGKLFEDVA